MGIYIGSRLLVGTNYTEISHLIDSDGDRRKQLEDLGIETASPWFDADLEDCFVGYFVPNFTAPNENWYKWVKEKAEQFEKVTGIEAVIFGGADVW